MQNFFVVVFNLDKFFFCKIDNGLLLSYVTDQG